MIQPLPRSTLFPYTTLFRSLHCRSYPSANHGEKVNVLEIVFLTLIVAAGDRKSTRLNSSHTVISYAVFCLKKKTRRDGAHRWCRSNLHDVPIALAVVRSSLD